jgi:transcriptional regulator with XRE-family HTH domain
MDERKARRGSANQAFMRALKRHRLAKGLSMHDVASRLKVHVSTVGAWETGRNIPRAEIFPKLARVLGVDPLELTKIVEPEPVGALTVQN